MLPEQDAVVVTTACTTDVQRVLDAVWARLLPGFDAATADRAAQTRLDERLAGLSLRPAGGTALPRLAAARYDVESPTPLVEVELTAVEQQWHLRLVEARNALAFPVASGEWAVSEPRDGRGDPVPVAASGGAGEDGGLHVEVVFLETPHRLDLELDPTTRTARATWRVEPLGDQDLASMHCPRPTGAPTRRAAAERAHGPHDRT